MNKYARAVKYNMPFLLVLLFYYLAKMPSSILYVPKDLTLGILLLLLFSNAVPLLACTAIFHACFHYARQQQRDVHMLKKDLIGGGALLLVLVTMGIVNAYHPFLYRDIEAQQSLGHVFYFYCIYITTLYIVYLGKQMKQLQKGN